jgi:hypothetical protein
MAFLFIFSGSRKTLYIGSAVSAGILVIICQQVFSIDPMIGHMFYLPLLLEAFLLIALLMKTGGSLLTLGDSKEIFVILTLAIFNVYNFLGFSLFADLAHFQMGIFPWLVLVGYAFYLIYSRSCTLLMNAEFAARWRKTGIFVAAAVPFLVPCVGRALSIFHMQYMSNVGYCENTSESSGKKYESILKKMEGEKGGIYINSAFLEQIEEIVQHIQNNTSEEDYLFGAPSTGMFNFLAGRRFPSKYIYFLFSDISEEQQRELAKDLSEKKPEYYIFDNFHQHDSSVSNPLEAEKFFWQFPVLGTYISSNYEFERKTGRFYLFRRIAADRQWDNESE